VSKQARIDGLVWKRRLAAGDILWALEHSNVDLPMKRAWLVVRVIWHQTEKLKEELHQTSGNFFFRERY